jgi:hypothetical protein
MSLEMAHKGMVPQKKNYFPQLLKQQYINSYIAAQTFFIYSTVFNRSQYNFFLFFFANFLCTLIVDGDL